MKVLSFTPLYRPYAGGIEIVVESLARSLRERGTEMVIVTNDSGRLPSHEICDGTVVHRLGISRPIMARDLVAQLQVLQQIVEIYRTERPDLIHMHAAASANAWYVDRLLRKIAPVPFIVTQHGVLEPEDRVNVARHLLLAADAVTAVSQAVMRSALHFSNRTAFSTVIPNGLPRVALERRAMDVRPKLLCVGRLQLEKGFDLAVEALVQVRRLGIDAELTVIGQGEERAQLERLAGNLGLTAHVHFKGVLDHANALAEIAASSIVLVPSRTREGFSLVAAEAALAGVPCVASRVGGLPETVEDGVTGLVVNPDDANGLALAVIRLLKDEKLRSAMGENARRRAAVKFDLERCVDRYAELYASVCSGLAKRNNG